MKTDGKLKIEFVEYEGEDREERLREGLDILVDLLLREYERRQKLSISKRSDASCRQDGKTQKNRDKPIASP
ncbi:hypothetical protein KAW50_02120 [candidate division WOR-3 bacterium]|nr:hypothetical protein [candidate division WOR-3 bacterium]